VRYQRAAVAAVRFDSESVKSKISVRKVLAAREDRFARRPIFLRSHAPVPVLVGEPAEGLGRRCRLVRVEQDVVIGIKFIAAGELLRLAGVGCAESGTDDANRTQAQTNRFMPAQRTNRRVVQPGGRSPAWLR
jgi:hypothetical protein